MFEAYCREKLGPLALRVALGLFGVYHGFVKITASGGMSWSPGLGMGWQLAIAWGQLAAGMAILVGLYCRLAAFVLLGTTLASWSLGMGWGLLRLPVADLEPFLLLVLAGLALLFLGAGELSLDSRGGPRFARKKV